MGKSIKHIFRESLDVRDDESCYFENLITPNVTSTTLNHFGKGRTFEPEFRESINFFGFGEGDLNDGK